MKEIDKGVLEETEIFKFCGSKAEQKRKWRERERESWREENMEKMKREDSETYILTQTWPANYIPKILNFFEFSFIVL